MGVAVLAPRDDGIHCRFARPGCELRGEPDPRVLADYLARLCREARAGWLLIDGPQAWKDPSNGLEHQRICEKALATQAKTGLPGRAKPSTQLRFVAFSIELFDRLHALGWPRLESAAAPPPRAVESFPTGAWRGLGLSPLPSKRRASAHEVETRSALLARRFRVSLAERPNHDELQALVAGLGGVALALGDSRRFALVGVPPQRRGTLWREGFILNPHSGAAGSSAPTWSAASAIATRSRTG